MNNNEEKIINLNFYQVELPNDGSQKDIKEKRNIISNSFKNPPSKSSKINREDGSSISLLRSKLHNDANGLIYGTLIHNQKNDLPFSFDDETQTDEALGIAENRGLGYETSFVLDPVVNIVMIENVKNGVSIGSFCRFFEDYLNVKPIEYNLVINPSEMQKLYDMTAITKFAVKIASLRNGDPFAGKKVSSSQIINAADKTNTDTLEMSLSIGFNRGTSLDLSTIRSYVKDFLKIKTDDKKQLQKLLISGKVGDESPTDIIDLIEQRLKDTIKVKRVRLNSLDSLNDRYGLLTTKYLLHQQSLRIAYKLRKI